MSDVGFGGLLGGFWGTPWGAQLLGEVSCPNSIIWGQQGDGSGVCSLVGLVGKWKLLFFGYFLIFFGKIWPFLMANSTPCRVLMGGGDTVPAHRDLNKQNRAKTAAFHPISQPAPTPSAPSPSPGGFRG